MPRGDYRAVERNDTITGLFASMIGEDSPLVSWNRKVEDKTAAATGEVKLLCHCHPAACHAHVIADRVAERLAERGYDVTRRYDAEREATQGVVAKRGAVNVGFGREAAASGGALIPQEVEPTEIDLELA